VHEFKDLIFNGNTKLFDRLTGCGTALVTPFSDGNVDYAAYTAIVKEQVAAGINFFRCHLAPLLKRLAYLSMKAYT